VYIYRHWTMFSICGVRTRDISPLAFVKTGLNYNKLLFQGIAAVM
jgi:hypothetical protein